MSHQLTTDQAASSQGSTVAIIGAGQLGYLLCAAARELGLATLVVTPDADAPAHLPGMVVSLMPLSVVGVPICATNAGILAAQILGAGDDAVRQRVSDDKRQLEELVMQKVAQLEQDA